MEDYSITKEDVSGWKQSDCILKICGDNLTLTQAHEKNFFYGGTRKKLKYQDGKVSRAILGRAAEADDKQKCKNAARVQGRRNAAIRDRLNCNEYHLRTFETLTGAGNYRDLSAANADRRYYFDRLERFIRTGKLFGKSLQKFTPQPDFIFRCLGVPEFQDGHRNKDGIGTGNVHFHHFHNCPFLPQVYVLKAKKRDVESQEWCEVYLCEFRGQKYWSKVADRNTLFFESQKEAMDAIGGKEGQKSTEWIFAPEPKRLCVAALLWERGHTKLKKIEDLRKQGKLSNAGEYLCQYIGKGALDDRLRNRRGWYQRGKLQKPDYIREPGKVDEYIREMNLWEAFTHKYEFQAEYIGAMTKFHFNFWILEYPWMRKFYELREQGKRMTPADWQATLE
jgi:hypothetical protein